MFLVTSLKSSTCHFTSNLSILNISLAWKRRKIISKLDPRHNFIFGLQLRKVHVTYKAFPVWIRSMFSTLECGLPFPSNATCFGLSCSVSYELSAIHSVLHDRPTQRGSFCLSWGRFFASWLMKKWRIWAAFCVDLRRKIDAFCV